MMCEQGLRTFLPDYWRGYNDWNVSVVTSATTFHTCADSSCNTSATGEVSCTAYHTGPLCSLCVEGYATTPSGGCIVCPSKAYSALIMALVLVVLCAMVTFLVARSATKRARPVLVLKIFINYVQVSRK